MVQREPLANIRVNTAATASILDFHGCEETYDIMKSTKTNGFLIDMSFQHLRDTR